MTEPATPVFDPLLLDQPDPDAPLQPDEIRADPTPPEPVVEVHHADIVGANLDRDDVAHACTITADGEVCIGCARPWPCPHAVRLRVEAIAPEQHAPDAETVVATSVSTGLPWRTVADQLGVPQAEVAALLGPAA